MAESKEIAPAVSTLTKLYYANDLKVEKKEVSYVQGIPEFMKAPEPLTYSALDISDERQAEGRQKAENIEVEILFTETQYDELKAIQTAKKNGYWFIQLPESTATESGKPLTWYFTATCFLGMSEIALDDMLKSKITLYRNSAIQESKGFPVEAVQSSMKKGE